MGKPLITDKIIEGYANKAIIGILNVVQAEKRKEIGENMVVHGQGIIELREKWVPKVKNVLTKVYDEATSDWSWWHKKLY